MPRAIALTSALLLLAAATGGPASASGSDPGRGLSRSAAPIPGLTITLSTNLATYPPEALHVLSASASSSTAVTVDAYVVIKLPTNEFFSLLASGGFAAGIVPYLANLSLPAGFTFPLQTIFSGTIPPLPLGTFTWMGGFTTPGTLEVVSNLAEASWTLAEDGPPPPPPPTTYTTEDRTINSNGVERSFLLALPDSGTAGLPLVISFHGDGLTSAQQRDAVLIEPHFTAVYAYPNAAEFNEFGYKTLEGRNAERQFTQDLIAALQSELGVDTSRVFLAGFSGGGITINFLGCYLGPSVIRGVGIHSGSLKTLDDDFTITYPADPDPSHHDPNDPQVASCALPHAILVWGELDEADNVKFATDGLDTRKTYLGTQDCQALTSATPTSPSPCVAYAGCTRQVHWCQIPDLPHDFWSQGGEAIGTFFRGLQ